MAYTDPILSLSDALYGVLALDDTLATLAPGGVFFDVPQNPSFPFIWLRLTNDQGFGGFNSRPGRGGRPGVQLRVHVYQSEYGTVREAQLVMARVVELLWNDTPLTADGYEVISGAPMPEPNQFRFTDEELRGIKVQESVLETDYVLEATA